MSDDDERSRRTTLGWLGPSAGMGSFVFLLVVGLGTMALGPRDNSITDLKEEVRDINVRMAPLLTLKAQHESDLQVIKTMQDDIREKLDSALFGQFKDLLARGADKSEASLQDRVNEMLEQIHKLEQNIVPRSENENEWRELKARTDSVQNELEALRLRVENLSEVTQVNTK